MREADLNRHLSNPKDPEKRAADKAPDKAAEKATDKPADPAAEKAQDAAVRKPIEFGSADDYQLQQAMNLLKGKPVEIAKAKDDKDDKGGDDKAKNTKAPEDKAPAGAAHPK